MKKTQWTGKLIRCLTIAAVAAAGTAMFAAAARTKMLPAAHLAALGGILALLGGLIALVILGGKKARLCAGVLLAAPYIFLTLTGFTMANRTVQVLRDSVVSISPTMPPAATAEPAPEPEVTAEPAPEPEVTAEPAPEPTAEPEYPDVFTIYVSGIDSRKGLVDKSFSDVNTLFTVNRNTHQVTVITTPRDAFVPLSISDGVRDKLTHAGQFGIDVQVDTMKMIYDIDIDYWFRVNFTGFEDIIDALGGVTVDSDYEFTSIEFDFADQVYTFNKGENVLNGDQALVFARERKSFSDGDLQRGRDQMKLIKAMIDKILSPDMLMNYSDVLDSLDGCFETTVPYDLLAQLVRDQLANSPEWNVVCYELSNGKGDSQETYFDHDAGKRYVMWLNDDDVALAKDMMAKVRNGEIVEQP